MQLQYIDNFTPLEWFAFEKMAPKRGLYDVVVVKAQLPMAKSLETLALKPEDAHGIAIEMADLSRQSELGAYAPLNVAGDTVLFKPATDLLLSGHARPNPSHANEWPVQITVQTRTQTIKQTLALQGPRHWQHSFGKGWHLSAAKPVEALPLIYELAYGGSYMFKDEWIHHEINPAGRGFMPARHLNKEAQYPAAQIELLKDRLQSIDRPIAIPALGPINRVWDIRSQYAGTYDQAWFEQVEHSLGRDYPQDFDLQFFQVAARPWIFKPYLSSGDTIELLGFQAQHGLYARIPQWQPVLSFIGLQQKLPAVMPMVLDTVDLRLDSQSILLTWRASIHQDASLSQARILLSNRSQSQEVLHG